MSLQGITGICLRTDGIENPDICVDIEVDGEWICVIREHTDIQNVSIGHIIEWHGIREAIEKSKLPVDASNGGSS